MMSPHNSARVSRRSVSRRSSAVTCETPRESLLRRDQRVKKKVEVGHKESPLCGMLKNIWGSGTKCMRLLIVTQILVCATYAACCIWQSRQWGNINTCLEKGGEAAFKMFGLKKESEEYREASDGFTTAEKAFWACFWSNILTYAITALVYGFNQYVYKTFQVHWRAWLTEHIISRYYKNRQYYKLMNRKSLDNPGARITDDVEAFTKTYSKLFAEGLGNILIFIMSSWQLYNVNGVKLMISLWVFVIIFLAILFRGFAQRLAKYSKRVAACEADFRKGLIQTRENAESIAFYSAGTHEHGWATSRLTDLKVVMIQFVNFDALVTTIDKFIQYIVGTVPFALLAGSFFTSKQKGTDAVTFGNVMLVRSCFWQIYDGLCFLSKDLPKISKMKASCRRVWEILAAFDEEDKNMGRTPTTSVGEECDTMEFDLAKDNGTTETRLVNHNNQVVLRDVSLFTPDRSHQLVQNLNVLVRNGESLLIMGPSGVGKSSLLRAICGLWDLKHGSVSLPEASKMMFLPQNGYIPDIPLEENTIESQLIFPRVCDPSLSEEDYHNALNKVNLGKLLGPDGIKTTGEWRTLLSNGEQQRLAMARLLLTKPSMAFLDEATASLDAQNEALLYSTLQEQGCTYVSVGHKHELIKYHTHILDLSPGGDWSIRRTSRD